MNLIATVCWFKLSEALLHFRHTIIEHTGQTATQLPGNIHLQ